MKRGQNLEAESQSALAREALLILIVVVFWVVGFLVSVAEVLRWVV